MAATDAGGGAAAPPLCVSLAAFSPSISPLPRRLSSCFSKPGRPVPAARRQLAWISLEGRLVGAQEAASARSIGGGLGNEEALAWELFSPLHRVLIVAVVAAVSAESKKVRKIVQLQRSVDVRDQVLQSMQQKLDDLCQKMSNTVDQPPKSSNKIYPENDDLITSELSEVRAEFNGSGAKLLELNPESGIPPLPHNRLNNAKEDYMMEAKKDAVFRTTHVDIAEQEERRMSDLSDFCSSIASSMDIQLSTLAMEQDFYNLRKECEEKDSTIKELTAAIHASSLASSKRIAELEEVNQRKNMVITKMKKDMLVMEQQVIHLTRLRRQSSASSNSNSTQLPFLASNILYDLSSTSSSSDSDSPSKQRENYIQGSISSAQENAAEEFGSHSLPITKFATFQRSLNTLRKHRSAGPLKENSMNQDTESTATLRPKQLGPLSGDFKRTRRRTQQDSKSSVSQKRWQ